MCKKVFLFLTATTYNARNGSILELLTPSLNHGRNLGLGQWLADVTHVTAVALMQLKPGLHATSLNIRCQWTTSSSSLSQASARLQHVLF